MGHINPSWKLEVSEGGGGGGLYYFIRPNLDSLLCLSPWSWQQQQQLHGAPIFKRKKNQPNLCSLCQFGFIFYILLMNVMCTHNHLHRTKFEEKVTFTKASTRQKLPMTSLVYPIWFHLGGVQNKRPRRSGGHQRWAKTGSGVPSIARMRPPTQVSKTDSGKSKMVTDLY